MEVSGHLHALVALTLEKESLVPPQQKAGWASQPVWMWWQRTIFKFNPYWITMKFQVHGM